MTFEITPSDRDAVLATLEELRAEPAPPDRRPLGCVLALPGFLVLLVFPVVGKMLGVGAWVATVVTGLGILAVVTGVVLWLVGGRAGASRAAAATEVALRVLERPDETDRDVLLRATVLLLFNANALPQGGGAGFTFDAVAAQSRLAGRLPLVEAVEGILVEADAAYPVFTASGTSSMDAGSEEDPST